MIGTSRRAPAALAACGAAMLLAGSALAAPDPECRCRAPGGAMRDLGTIECFDIGARKVGVRCEMSTNTPYWRPLDEKGDEGGADEGGCPAPA